MSEQARFSTVGGPESEEEKNMWSQLLKQARETSKGHTKSAFSTLYFVGNPKCGKTSILSRWKDRVSSKSDIPEYVLDYSYVNVKNKFNLETEDTISRMGIWQLNDDKQAKLLPNVMCDPASAAFVICLDLSEPHSLIKSLKKWLKVYKDTSETLLSGYSEELGKSLKEKITNYVCTFVDPTIPKKEEKEEEKEEEVVEEVVSILNTKTKKQKKVEEKEAAPVEKVVDPNIPANNYGIPLFIVGLKADSFEQTGEDEKFSFVTRRLRQESLKYGATLIFSSSYGDGINTDVLKDQIFHRLFDLPLVHKPITTGTCTQWPIHIPAGHDSEKDINSSTFSDGTTMAEVFEWVEETKEEKKDDIVKARSDQEFFDSLRPKLGNGRRVNPMSGETHSKKKKEKAVKSFFKSLLSGENQ